ncbi:flavin-dependent dehydrogenase [Sinorhizobium meliloti]
MSMRRITDTGALARHYDLVVVGAGPAGLSAAIEAGRGRRLRVGR